MRGNCRLSKNTQVYLETYRTILDDMICGMTSAQLNNSISHNFIVQMIPHHEAAIRMSENLLQYTTDICLQNIAEDIIREQTESIRNIQEVLGCCCQTINCRQELYAYQRQVERIFHRMFSSMENACAENDINVNFMREMIPHHRGAVEFSELTLKCNICPELRPILQSIIKSQRRGICQMQELLNERES